MKNQIFSFLFLCLALGFNIYHLVYQHELVHLQAFKRKGVDAEIKWLKDCFEINAWVCVEFNESQYVLLREEDKRDLYLVNMQNDIVGYHVVGVLPFVVALVFLGVCKI